MKRLYLLKSQTIRLNYGGLWKLVIAQAHTGTILALWYFYMLRNKQFSGHLLYSIQLSHVVLLACIISKGQYFDKDGVTKIPPKILNCHFK